MPPTTSRTQILCLSAVLALCAPVAITPVASAQQSTMQQGNGSNKLSPGDRKFLTMAMEGNMAETQLAKLALQKTSNADVRQFAQKMVDDHTQLQSQAEPIAEQVGVQEPTQVAPKDQALMTKLQAMNGTEFDKAYANAMVSDHKEDLKEFKKEETSGKDQSVKDLATQGEPVIAEHLQLAQALQKKVG